VAVLKDWLSSHCIHNVDAGNGQKKKPPKMKKKRRRADLDDFIVDSSDEDEEFGSFTDVDGDIPSPRPIQERSRVRKQPRSSTPAKNANVLVISGPHGCGKTAAVYAVARELDFEVFEINSGSRRSGKDILDKIGDMAENHLVQRISKAASTEDTIDSADDIVETVEDRGRQGNMTSFFKPVATKKTSKPKSTDDQATKVANSESRRQKQSLILFEEVDILFEDDKQFWPTVIALAVHCKRPIILTCTDETRVPMESLILHAVLRLTPPPTSMAADYLLAMAACEGHILDLQAVQGLYVTKQRDLRACIAELNFRCRMSIGSRRGGLDWMVARWPPGCDLDANGEKLRVVSEGTYQAGMEWENRDFAAEERAEELAFGESLAWGLPLDELAFSSDFRASVNDGSSVIDTLEAVCDARSSADVFCRAGLRNDFTVRCFR
jgi:DNA polymerase III delta prime subunit